MGECMIKARNLSVLYIDDRQTFKTDPLASFLTFLNVSSVRSVHEHVLENRSARDKTPVDIILCDVDMSANEGQHPEDVTWGTSADVTSGTSNAIPYGPLLALPMLGASSIQEFVPFSSYWQNPEVHNHGFVLIAMSMILTSIHGMSTGLTDTRERIKAIGGLATDPQSALEFGLSGIRRRILDLAKKNDIKIAGVDNVLSGIKDIASRELKANSKLASEASPLPLPLQNEAPLFIELFHGNGQIDRIFVSSLCADLLEFRAPMLENDLQIMLEELKHWEKFSISGVGEDIYSAAVSLLVTELEGGDHDDTPIAESTPIWERVKQTRYCNETAGDPQFLARITVLLAMTRAWYLKRFYPEYSDVMTQVYWFLGIRESSSGSKQQAFKDLMGHRRVYKGPHVRPFKAKYDERNPIDKYSLVDDEPADLDDFEKWICRKFVTEGDVHPADEIEPKTWDPDHDPKHPFPRWMI